MCETLAQVPAIAPGLQRRDTKHHLRPPNHGERTSKHTVDAQHNGPHVFFLRPCEMESKIYATCGLCEQSKEQDGGKGAVDRVRELASAVILTKEKAYK